MVLLTFLIIKSNKYQGTILYYVQFAVYFWSSHRSFLGLSPHILKKSFVFQMQAIILGWYYFIGLLLIVKLCKVIQILTIRDSNKKGWILINRILVNRNQNYN